MKVSNRQAFIAILTALLVSLSSSITYATEPDGSSASQALEEATSEFLEESGALELLEFFGEEENEAYRLCMLDAWFKYSKCAHRCKWIPSKRLQELCRLKCEQGLGVRYAECRRSYPKAELPH